MNVEVDELALPQACPLLGKSVAETEARRKHGLLVVAVKRADGNMVFNPDAEFRFAAGDIVIVMGPPESIERFRTENALA
jgi:voltage-gated potassium channel